MKRKMLIIFCVCFSVAVMVLTDISSQTVRIMGLDTAYAMGSWGSWQHGDPDKNCDGNKPTTSVNEPATLLLVGAGVAGVGIYTAIRRRNKKK
jgi:hypothetical protein